MALTETKLLSGWYRISGDEFFGNVKHERRGEHRGKWTADLRIRQSGDLVQYAGAWNTKADAVEEVTHLINQREWVSA